MYTISFGTPLIMFVASSNSGSKYSQAKQSVEYTLQVYVGVSCTTTDAFFKVMLTIV